MTSLLSSADGERSPFLLRVEDYELLDRAGAFYGQRVELIAGRLVVVNAQFKAHALFKNRLGRRLQDALQALGSSAEAIIEGTLALSAHDLPDPDILVGTITPGRDYIRVEQVTLVIEVADTSLRHDLGEKRDLYAAGGVLEYWVVDLNGGQVHQFWSIKGGLYAQSRAVPLAGPLVSITQPDLAVDGAGIL